MSPAVGEAGSAVCCARKRKLVPVYATTLLSANFCAGNSERFECSGNRHMYIAPQTFRRHLSGHMVTAAACVLSFAR
jgi:hypothetical protein